MTIYQQYIGAKYVGNYAVYTKNSYGGFGTVAMSLNEASYTTLKYVVLTGEAEFSSKGNLLYSTTARDENGTQLWVMLGDGWEFGGYEVGKSGAQNLIRNLIENNKFILKNNLVCAKFADRLSTSERYALYDLQERLARRDDALRNGQLVTNTSEARAPEGYRELAPYLEAFMSRGRVGAILSTPTIIVSAVALASVATASYFLWKSFYDESERDVKFSEGLMKTLQSKLTEAEYEELLRETRGIVTKAKIKASFSALGGLGKWLLIGVGGYAVYQFAKKNYKKKK